MKKFAACLLTMAMLLSMMTPVFAEEATTTPGSITINNTVKGQTYSLYKMFDLESYDGDNFSYKVCEEWKNFFVSGAEGAKYIVLDDHGYIASTTLNDENKEAFAKTALAWAKDAKMEAFKSEKAEGDTLTFKDLPLGYYLVDSTLGTLCTLNTNISDATFFDKNEDATITFTVKNKNGDFDTIHDADMNSTLNYRIEVFAKAGAENYQIYVQKPTGIDANLELVKGTIEVIIQPELNPLVQEVNDPYTLTQNEHYSVHEPESANNSEIQESQYNFRIEIDQAVLDQIKEDAIITITYQAELTTKASYSTVSDAYKNTSSAWMSYGESSSTEKKETDVYTYYLPIYKYTEDADGQNHQALSGAKFRLYRKLKDGTIEYASFTQGKFYQWTKEEYATVMTSNNNGKIELFGLSTGTYYLEETEAPAGYNKLLVPIEIRISAGDEQKAVYAQDNVGTELINVLNNTGSQLPSTGGMGTKIFYALGATMFVSAIILLVVRKRMSK